VPSAGGDAGGGVEGADAAVPACGFHPEGRDTAKGSGLAVKRVRDTCVEEDDAVDEGTEQRGLQGL